MSSQPIALPPSTPNNYATDYPMASGSYTGSPNGSFNPASYTRHFLGSPISWRPGSLGIGGRVFPNGSPMDHILSSVEYNKHSASYESDRGSIINALGVVDREDELCRNYQCCGLKLTDLHALIEHFEEVHIIVVDNPSAPGGHHAQIGVPFNPLPIPTVVPPQQQQGPSVAQIASSHPQQSQVPIQQVPGQPATQGQGLPPQAPYPVPFDPDEMELEMEISSTLGYPVSQAPSNKSSPSSGAPTPPDTPVSTPLSPYTTPPGYPSPKAESHPPQLSQLQVPHSPYTASPHNSPYGSQPPSPLAYGETFESVGLIRAQSESCIPSGLSGRANPNLNLSCFSHSPSSVSHDQLTTEAFNVYYSAEYSVGMPGTKVEGDTGIIGQEVYRHNPAPVKVECLPPSLVFSNAPTPEVTPSTSRVPSPAPLIKSVKKSASLPSPPVRPTLSIPTPASLVGVCNSNSGSTTTSPTSTPSSPITKSLASSASRAHTASLLLSKPFKCPKPNCNKSYKQANGLKYHITHGSCSFAPPKDLEHVQAILEKKRRDRAAQAAAAEGITPSDHDRSSSSDLGDLSTISESDLREVEKEAELRLKPYACGVGDCPRRYKNMNGLRYHYHHSGEHGYIGLSMLASGVHECLNNGNSGNGTGSRPSSKPNSRSVSRTGTPVPTQNQAMQQPQHNAVQSPSVAAYSPTLSHSSSSSSLAAAATAQVQAQAQLAYQHNQRVQQQLAQQSASSGQQQQQLQQMQAQFAAMHNRLYTGQSDTPMSG